MGFRVAAPEPLGPRNRSRALQEASRALQEASRCCQEQSKRAQDALKNAPRGLKTAPRALKRPQDAVKSGPRGLKTAPRALGEASRHPQERCKRTQDSSKSAHRPQDVLKSIPRCFKSGGFLKSIFERSRGCSRSLNIKPTWIWGSTSPKVSVQRHIRRTCSIPLSSIQQASGRLAPCMSMHGSTLVYTYIQI